MPWIAALWSLLAIASAGAAELTPNPDADAKFAQMEKSIVLYRQSPYTIEKALETNEVAGLSLVIIYDGKPAIHRWYGQEIKRKDKKTDAQTIYQCASTSKLVSALGVVTAASRGEVQLDEPVTAFNRAHRDTLLTEWVAKYFKGDTASWADDISLRRLLSHSAGLDLHGIGAAPWLPSKAPLESIILGKSIFKDAAKPIHEPGTQYDYSGGGFTVAEAWLEIATGQKFKDYLKSHVLTPLGMSQSTYETGSTDTPHLAWGCSRGLCLYNVRTLDVKAAGGLLCHPVDYARLVALLMNGGKEYLPGGNGRQLIPATDVAQILSPSRHKDTAQPLVANGAWYGLGTSLSKGVSTADGLSISFNHGGAQQGSSIEFFADRDRKLGIVVMVNGDREWSRQKEQYGGGTLSVAIVRAFKVAFGLANAGGPLQPRCSVDTDCPSDKFCNAGVDFDKNSCEAKKPNNAACAVVGGGHQCASGQCSRYGRCYTADSVAMGGTCYTDAACDGGKCTAVDGARGTCVCQKDGDCQAGLWCNAGLDLARNSCVALKPDNATCDVVGGGHQCASGHCGFGRCYTANSVAMGGTCYTDAACSGGKCSAIDGARGTCVCQKDGDCGTGEYCNAGLDLAKNSCIALKSDNATCDVIGGGHQCASGTCSTYGRCYTAGAVAAGGTCYTDAACSAGKCSAIDGARGTCVCKSDGDCDAGQWCDAGTDTKINACRVKLNAGQSCGKAGSVGNDHKCKSSKCSGFPKYECK